MKKIATLLVLVILALLIGIGAQLAARPAFAAGITGTEAVVTKTTSSGWLVSPSATSNVILRECWAYAGNGILAVAVTTPTRTIGYFTESTNDTTPVLDLTTWDRSGDKDNGGVNCLKDGGCYYTVTSASANARLQCHVR